MLRALARGLPAGHGLHGKSAYGGLTRTMAALARQGLVKGGEITDAGRALVLLHYGVVVDEGAARE